MPARSICGSLAGVLALVLAVLPTLLLAEDVIIPKAATYCADLLRITDIAASQPKFAVIAGKVREGNFLETTLPLAGWKECSLYGTRTYTCDSEGFATAMAAEMALAGFVKDVTACLGEGWAADKNRSSPDYVVVQKVQSPVAMTLSTDTMDSNGYTVRLIVFVRGRSNEKR